MAPTPARLKILSVGGNAVSAFLSWRLQATNACDVTVVWKKAHEHVAQYGISFKSATFGNERFKPRRVFMTPEEAAASNPAPYDYVILSIKALPDVYDLAAVIESVVTPGHTCVLVNTTHSLGVEDSLAERFPSNTVLSIVLGAELTQLGTSEFQHKGSSTMWLGPACTNPSIPKKLQEDMAEALAMTLGTGQIDCRVSPNIRQQQYERVIGPIAFHPLSVLLDMPNHQALLAKVGARDLVSGIIDELLALAAAHGCTFPGDFKDKTVEEMTRPTTTETIMWQDYMARRPMEIETYLGSPMKLAKELGVPTPRIETIYTLFNNLNVVNQQRPKTDGLPMLGGSPSSPAGMSPLPRTNGPMSMPPRPMVNGIPPQRPRNGSTAGVGPRRPPPTMGGGPPNGHPRPNGPSVNGYPGSRQQSRRGSLEGTELGEEFSHLAYYGEDAVDMIYDPDERPDVAIRERDPQMRPRDQPSRLGGGGRPRGPPGVAHPRMGPPGQGPGPRRGPPPQGRFSSQAYDDEDDDYFDPTGGSGPPLVDPDTFDMMSVTSRKNRVAPPPNQSQFRRNPEIESNGPAPPRPGRFRPTFGNRNRSSQLVSVPAIGDNILEDPMMHYSSNRYGNVDRAAIGESRTNSITSQRLDELQYGMGPGGPNPTGAVPRRASQSPGNPYPPTMRGAINGRPSPPNGAMPSPNPNGYPNGRPSPPDPARQQGRSPAMNGNPLASQPIEQHVGVSAQPPIQLETKSLTGSASASANSDNSQLNSGSSVQSNQGSRWAVGVR